MSDSSGDEDATAEVASVLGLDVATLVALVGGPWSRVPHPSENLLSDASHDDWWMAGDPVQLMLTRESSGDVLLAVPRARWQGWDCAYEPGRTLRLYLDSDPAAVQRAVAEALRLRRSTFRYCRYCRGLTPPEYRDEPDVCMGCSERWLGAVH